MECIEEDGVTKPKYRSVSGKIRLRCNDCGKDHEVFLRHRIAKFVGGSPSFKEVQSYQRRTSRQKPEQT
jgi:hypothetical protein